MKRADRLARSGAFTAGETIRRERPFGLTLLGIVIAIVSILVLSRACSGAPVNALVAVSPVPVTAGFTSSAGSDNHELLLPVVSVHWPLPTALSNCDSEVNPCS